MLSILKIHMWGLFHSWLEWKKMPATDNHKKNIKHRFYMGKISALLVSGKKIFPRGNLPTPPPSNVKWFAPNFTCSGPYWGILALGRFCTDLGPMFPSTGSVSKRLIFFYLVIIFLSWGNFLSLDNFLSRDNFFYLVIILLSRDIFFIPW